MSPTWRVPRWLIGLDGTTSGMLDIGGNLDLSAVDSLDVVGTGTGSSWLIATYDGTLDGMFDNITPGYDVDYSTIGELRLVTVAVDLPGDHNGDGAVDAADYVAWAKILTVSAEIPMEYDDWREKLRQFRARWRWPGLCATVPEPATVLLVVWAIGGMAVVRSRTKASSAKSISADP